MRTRGEKRKKLILESTWAIVLLGALLGKAFTAAGHVSTDKAVLVRAESHMWLILSLLTQIVLDGCSRTLSVRRKLASGSAWGRGFVLPVNF